MLRFLTFLIGVMMVNTSSAGEVSQCPVDSVPIQVTGWGNTETTLSALRPSDSRFPAFVTAVTEHVAARLGSENLCLNSTESKERSLLQFMHWSISTRTLDGPTTPVTSLDMRPSNGCSISSPWIDLAIEQKPVPWVRAIVRWNRRQFFADQAVLAGAKDVPPGVAKPLTMREYGSFEGIYVGPCKGGRMVRDSLEAKLFNEEGVPPDILWLFRHLPPNCGPRGSHRGAGVFKKEADSYTKLVLALIDRCFASNNGANLQYDNILDAADLISLEQYKIDSLRN